MKRNVKRLLLGSLACAVWLAASPAVGQARHPSGRRAIGDRIQEMIGDEMKGWCEAKGVAFPPDKVLFRVFKLEKQIEIWAMNDGQKSMQLVHTGTICDMDFSPGPKLKQSDSKTPEGFYYIERGSFGTGSRLGFMWMCLDDARIDDSGVAKVCSVVKICIDYPNDLDNVRSKKGLGISDPGDAICIHGNCISDGCISFKNRDFLPVYGFAALHHRSRNDKLQLHIFPFRFKNKEHDLNSMAIDPKTQSRMGDDATRRFWRNLKTGHDLFEETGLPLMVATEVTLEKGSKGRPVKQLQTVLKELGHYDGALTGTYGDATVEAVKNYQAANKLRPTGRIGRRENDKLQMYWYKDPLVEKLISQLETASTATPPGLKIDECRDVVEEVTRRARPESLVELAESRLKDGGRRWQAIFWTLAQMGSAAGDALPQLLGLLKSAPRSTGEFDQETAAVCHAISKIADGEERVAALNAAAKLAGPTRLWCVWAISHGMVEESAAAAAAAAMGEVEATFMAVQRERLSLLEEVGGSFGGRRREDPPYSPDFAKMRRGLIEAGRPALPILQKALLSTVGVPAKGPGRDTLSNELCSAVLFNAGIDALPCIKEAVNQARAYSLGGGMHQDPG